jgi:DNA repair protein RadB
MTKISTGSKVLDKLLDGGYETDVVTTLYGPAGSGKTTTCLLAAISAASAEENKDKKVVFIDTEGGFSTDRLGQLSKTAEKTLSSIMHLKVTNFDEQKKCIKTLSEQMSQKICMVVCDTVSSLYRLERGENNANLNRELSRQLSAFLTLARTKNIPVLIATPVYADFENKANIKMVGGDIIKYSSKCLIELKINENKTRTALLSKHRSIPEREIAFKIKEEGFEEA